MKQLILTSWLLAFGLCANAQNDATSLLETGKQFLRSGDFSNAILVFNKALQQTPNQLAVLKELGMAYYLQRDFVKAKETVKPLIEREDADVQTFQIAGNIFKALEEVKECDRMYRRGIKKFPDAGPLYAEHGDLLWRQKDFSAISQWENGIKNDPNYPGNYYYAAKHYFMSTDKVWALIYGEIFVNMESYTSRTAEIKNLLLEAYKKLFAEENKVKTTRSKSAFAQVFYNTLQQYAPLAASGVHTETLIALRTRFLLEWDKQYAVKYPYRLFDLHRQLLQEGMFEAYNHWIFTAAGNLAAFDQWTKAHGDAYNAFSAFQRGRVFKLPSGQYYQGN